MSAWAKEFDDESEGSESGEDTAQALEPSEQALGPVASPVQFPIVFPGSGTLAPQRNHGQEPPLPHRLPGGFLLACPVHEQGRICPMAAATICSLMFVRPGTCRQIAVRFLSRLHVAGMHLGCRCCPVRTPQPGCTPSAPVATARTPGRAHLSSTTGSSV